MKRFIPVLKRSLAPPPSPALKLPRAAFSFSGGAWRTQMKPVRTAYPGGLKAARGRVVFLFTCFLFFYVVSAQENKTVIGLHLLDSLKNVLKTQNDDTNKVNTLNRLSFKYEIFGNHDSGLLYAESAQALAEKISFKEGMANAYRNIGFIYSRQSNYQKALEYQYKSFTVCQKIGNKRGIATALNNIGLTYYALGNYSKALECYFKALTVAQEIENKNNIASIFCNIGLIYGEQGNYHKALEYLSKSLKIHIEKGNKEAIAVNLDDMAYDYLAQGDYPKALEYDFKAITKAREVGDKEVIANVLGDIGTIYYTQDNYTRALEYDFKAVTIAREIGNIDEVAILYSNTGEVYTRLKKYKQAKTFLDSALGFSKKTGNKKYTKITYGNLAALDSSTGNYKTAYDDYKKYMTYRDSIFNQGATQMEISYEFEKREDSIKAEYEKENIIKAAEMKRKKGLNDAAIVILVLIILLSLLLINRQQIKRKSDKLFFEKETNLLLTEKHRMEDELANARALLEDYVQSMVEKNKLLEESKVDLEKIEKLKAKEIDENKIESLEHLNTTTILTKDDWDTFKELFEQVYKGFFIRLKEKLPDLTQAEMRLVCLIKLKLDTKQTGAILGVSHETIRKSRYRLRKKLGLSGKDSLNDIANSI